MIISGMALMAFRSVYMLASAANLATSIHAFREADRVHIMFARRSDESPFFRESLWRPRPYVSVASLECDSRSGAALPSLYVLITSVNNTIKSTLGNALGFIALFGLVFLLL
jgi:hypothetical protein